MSQHILTSVVLSLLAAMFAYWRGYVTFSAALLAMIFGCIILVFSDLALGVSVGVCFFITSWLSSLNAKSKNLVNDNHKIIIAVDKKICRDLNQVLANGLTLVILAISYTLADDEKISIIAAFLGCVGAVAGDTWASDIGQLSKHQPRMLLTGKVVSKGTPGAVTVLGFLLTLLSGLIAAVVYLLLYWFLLVSPDKIILTSSASLILVVAAAIGGMLGALTDSLLGAFVQGIYQTANGSICDNVYDAQGRKNKYIKGYIWLSNNKVNFANSVVGSVSAYLIWQITQ